MQSVLADFQRVQLPGHHGWTVCVSEDRSEVSNMWECEGGCRNGDLFTRGQLCVPVPPLASQQPPGEAVESFAQPYDVVTACYCRVVMRLRSLCLASYPFLKPSSLLSHYNSPSLSGQCGGKSC